MIDVANINKIMKLETFQSCIGKLPKGIRSNGIFLRLFWLFSIIICCLYISTNWYQLLLIHGDSMEPAYHNMQMVILEKNRTDYTYGDVIAFQCGTLNALLVKRIVACPGDRVVIREGCLYVNEKESMVFPQKNIFLYAGIAGSEIKLEKDQYFVIGDHVEMSKDSRYKEIGNVERSAILGRVIS